MSEDGKFEDYFGDRLVTLKSVMKRMDEIEEEEIRDEDEYGVQWYNAWQSLRMDIKKELLSD